MVTLFFNQAHTELSNLVSTAIAQQFEEVDFANSRPAFRQREFSGIRAVNLGSAVPPDVFLYVGQAQPRPYVLLAILAPMGLLLGLLTAPKFVVTGRRALTTSVVSTGVLLVTVIIYFTLLPTQQRYSDTGVMLTTGTFAGLLLGILGYSFRAWWRTRQGGATAASGGGRV